MSKALWFLAVGIVALVFQVTLRHLGIPESFVPQIMVLLVVSLAFSEVNAFGCFMAFGLGLLLDLSSATLIGPWAGAFVVVFGALAVVSQRLFIDSSVASIVISFLAVTITDLLYLAMGAEYPIITWDLPRKIAGHAFITALIAPAFLGFLSRRARVRSLGAIGRGSVGTAV